MNWPLVIQVFGILVGGAISLYQIRHLLPASRATLKADLEILKLLDPGDAAFIRVKAHVDRAIERTYAAVDAEAPSKKPPEWGLLAFFVLLATGLVAWTVYLVRDGFNAWSLLTGTFAVVGMLGIVGVLDPDSPSAGAKKSAALKKHHPGS